MTMEASPYRFLARPTALSRCSVPLNVTAALPPDMVTLALAPGQSIDKTAICEQLGVSRFPVSEALARLQSEGLVDIAPQRGSTVSLGRLADGRECMLIRKALESEALRVLIGKHDATLIEALHANMANQRETAGRDDSEAFHQID